MQSEELTPIFCFPTVVVTAFKPEFLDAVRAVSEDNFEPQDINEIYPVKMTGNLTDDPRMHDFCEYVGSSAWQILNNQGSDMTGASTFFTEMWTQEHHKHSLMEQHVHGGGSQLVGFYFLETPENCSRAMFHDPRGGKVQINLPEANMSNATPASNIINFLPEPGMMLISNAWLPHSFGRHGSDRPIKFVHFNLSVQYAPQACSTSAAEVI